MVDSRSLLFNIFDLFLRALLPTDAEAPKLDKDKKKEEEERGGEKADKKKEKHGLNIQGGPIAHEMTERPQNVAENSFLCFFAQKRPLLLNSLIPNQAEV